MSSKPGLGDGYADASASAETGVDVLGCEEDGNRVLLNEWWCGWEWDTGMQPPLPWQAGTS